MGLFLPRRHFGFGGATLSSAPPPIKQLDAGGLADYGRVRWPVWLYVLVNRDA